MNWEEIGRTIRAIEKSAVELYQRDGRFRQICDWAVSDAMREHGRVHPERAEQGAHDIALRAVTLALTRAFFEDGEITALRMERDHYRSLAEKALTLSPSPLIFPPLSNPPAASHSGTTTD